MLGLFGAPPQDFSGGHGLSTPPGTDPGIGAQLKGLFAELGDDPEALKLMAAMMLDQHQAGADPFGRAPGPNLGGAPYDPMAMARSVMAGHGGNGNV